MNVSKLPNSRKRGSQNRNGNVKKCDNCFYHIHFPWICKPQLNGGRNCPDWKDPKEGVTV